MVPFDGNCYNYHRPLSNETMKPFERITSLQFPWSQTNETNKTVRERKRHKEHSIASSSIFSQRLRDIPFHIDRDTFVQPSSTLPWKYFSRVTARYRSEPDVFRNAHLPPRQLEPPFSRARLSGLLNGTELTIN